MAQKCFTVLATPPLLGAARLRCLLVREQQRATKAAMPVTKLAHVERRQVLQVGRLKTTGLLQRAERVASVRLPWRDGGVQRKKKQLRVIAE